jgi:hypothetical protein
MIQEVVVLALCDIGETLCDTGDEEMAIPALCDIGEALYDTRDGDTGPM